MVRPCLCEDHRHDIHGANGKNSREGMTGPLDALKEGGDSATGFRIGTTK